MTSNSPLVSVCVQTYQHAPYIKECLDSILAQETNFPFEILLGEDESTDGTREICKEYAEKYPETIRLFLRSRKDVIYINGIPTGRANLIDNLKNARGKYIALCEGDDYWLSTDKLQKQADFLERSSEYSGAYHETYMQYDKAPVTNDFFVEDLKSEMATEDVINYVAPFHTTSFLFRKEVINEFPDWFYKITSGDMALFFLVSLKGKLKKIPDIQSVYRKHGGGVTLESSNNRLRYHMQRIEMLNYFGESSNWYFKKKINREISRHLIDLILRDTHLKIKDLARICFGVLKKKL